MLKRRKHLLLLLAVAILVILINCFPSFITFSSSSTLTYYPSSYNLVGQTQYVSGSLSDLQSDNSVYMVFRSYVSTYSSSQSTFGYTTTGSSYANTEGTIRGSVFTLAQDGIAQSITAYIRMTTAAKNMKCMLYRHNDSSLVGTTEQRNIAVSTSWQTFNFLDPKPILIANTEYVIVAWSASGGGYAYLYYDTGSTNQGHYQSVSYGTPPNPATFTHNNYQYSIYCNYTSASEYTVELELNGTSNTESWSNLTWRIDGCFTTSSVTATFQLYNYNTSSYPTSGDGYIADTIGANDVTDSQTITTNPTYFRDASGNWKIKIKGIKSTNTPFDFKADSVEFEVTVADTSPPVWSNAGTNNTLAGQPTLFFVKWTDNLGLSGFIFGTNNTGTWSNDTWTPMSGTVNWSNVTKILNSTGGNVVQWRVWANDTSNNWNDTGTLSLMIMQRPVASFTYFPSNPYTGETVTFNASSSYDPNGIIVSYSWTFGDGTNATGMVVTHAYADNRVYTITLIVTDNYGLTDTNSQNITVLNRLPVAYFTENATTVYTGQVISFNASASYDPDGNIVSYFWDFGDGTNATGVTVNHAYTDDGNYIVTLIITDNDGAAATANATKIVLNRPPIASFTESATTVYRGEIINFNGTGSRDLDGSIVSYFWDFGDGTNATEIIVDHAYTNIGTFTVTLTVTDDDGATGTTTAVKTVMNRPPVAQFTESASTVFTDEVIYFNASESYDLDGYIVSYFWEFGDGTNASGLTVSHSYVDNGIYVVVLTVTDNEGATGTATATKTVLNKSPVASFTESSTVVHTGEDIQFNASASYDPDGVIVSYFWDFGDGTNATGAVASHAYSEDGTYVVTLTVTDNDGAISTATSTKTVLNRPPVASFTESATIVLTGEIITFNASASHDLDGSIVSYFWTFGDGANATGAFVTHAYADNGSYTVTLTVMDDDGATTIASATKTVLNRPPVAVFTESATIVFTGEVINFNASASYDPDGSIVSYFWDFGDGSNATGITVQHSYVNDGVYAVTLIITDDDGATASKTASKTVLNRLPVASFSESATTVYKNEVIHFNASASYDPDGFIVGYFWDFGDGTNATDVTVDHSYANVGTYTVTLTVTDNDGAAATASASKTVLSKPPVASFTESATIVYTGEVIYFNASSSYDPDGVIINYFWDFGDGTNGTGVVVSHAYADDGNYTVTLTVIDDDGTTASSTVTKTVLNRSPMALFTESAETVYTGEVITFDASASYDSDGSIVSYKWDFGDGNIATVLTSIITHAYADNGTYAVILTITDNDGATASASSIKTVLNRPPVASFTFSPLSPYTSETVVFNASASYDSDGSIINYEWNFGDGNITTVTTPTITHTYVNDGTYTVTLRVTDNDSAVGTASQSITVLNRPPVASFTESATTVFTNETIYFDASASYDSDGSIVSYFWDFGDGTNATGIAVSHAYADNGAYTVTLTVTDNDGATATATATKTVLNRSPTASFTESAETVYTGKAITFNASGSYDSDGTIASYKWDFGDGTNATGVVVDHAYLDDGIYTVTLTVTDDDGVTATANVTKTVLNRSPVASFTASKEIVLTGEIILFNASYSYDSDGAIVSYFWNFGDGSNATGMTVEHTYTENGVYTVTLTVTDDDGATGATSTTITCMNRPPVASFTESATTVDTGEVIYFNASNSYDPDGTIVSYLWDFGDGTNATGVTAQHAYSDNGAYNVTLTVTDNDCATATAIATKYVQNRPPAPSFTYSPSFPMVGETVNFNASDSYDPDGFIVSYQWIFGEGNVTTVTSPTITHTYHTYGNYTVTLIVTDNDGITNTISKTVRIRDYPTASFTYSPSFPIAGETVTFNASSSVPNGGVITSYLWDFGDGTSLVNTTNPTITHIYSTIGNLTVTLTVADSEELTNTTTDTVKIRGYPSASFIFSPSYPMEGETITFDASSSTSNGGVIVTYEWNFGDGNVTTVTDPIITHIYPAIGNYSVTLTVMDSEALSDSESKIVKVRGYPIATFTYTPEAPYVGDTVIFNASLSNPNGGVIISYLWDFGDGSQLLNTTNPITIHIYTLAGNHSVTLTITDSEELSDTDMHFVVTAKAPIATFTYSPQFPIVGETVTFSASGSYDPNGYIVNYTWNFGDSNLTTVTTPVITHVYTSTGVYTVILIITDNDGYTDIATATVTLGTPKALFTYTPESPIAGQTVTFNASGSYDPNGYIVSYVWNFGDGNITTVTDPILVHVYIASGNYTVTLTVADNQGLTDTTTQVVSVEKAPTASFTYTPASPYVGDNITFDASSSTPSKGNITSYVWDFGDGSPPTNTTEPIIMHSYKASGNCTVSLTITDSFGLSNIAKKVITIQQSPVAIFTYSPTYPEAFDTVTFNASDSYDANGYIISYVWNFGDGNVTTVTNPIITHVYTNAGNYTVILIVADNEGYTHSRTQRVFVSIRPPIADFTRIPDFPIAQESVTFNASASYDLDGYIISYLWDFGDGNVTATTSPIIIHVYESYGNYTVILTITDNDGLVDSKAYAIIVRDYPIADFTISPSIANVGSLTTFNASISTPNGGVILSYFWDFDDGAQTNTTDPIVTHTFNSIGNYTITLYVTDSEGLSGTRSKLVRVAEKPKANFSYLPTNPYVGDAVIFNASNSYDVDGYIVSYVWDFGDGSAIQNTANPLTNHTYSIGGNFTVTLTVIDNLGFNSTSSKLITVNKTPVAVFNYSPDNLIAGDVATFNASESYGIIRPISNYTWDFGDGNITTVTDSVITHIYAAEGNYTVRLIVTDTSGYADIFEKNLTIRNYPTADFTYSPSIPTKGNNVTFDASSSKPEGGVIINYVWDFGDDSIINTTAPVVVHTFAVVGNYNVTLTVIDSEGLQNHTLKVIHVADYPTAEFTWSPSLPKAAEQITFNASLSNANSGTITIYVWDFGDGSPILTTSSPIVAHAYSQAENYVVTLTVINSDGLSSSKTKSVTVLKASPIASFTYTPEVQITDKSVTFNASNSYDPDGSIVAYTWNFGDGNVTTTANPIISHIYKVAGNYTVTLNIADNDGLTASTTKTVKIITYPTADFAWSPSTPESSRPVTFNASASKANSGVIVSYVWDFGDGNLTVTADAVITHMYDFYGNYTVTLTVSNSEGLSANKTKTLTVIGCSPQANFNWQPLNPSVNQTVTFDASNSLPNGGVIVFYEWSFGDGSFPQFILHIPTTTHTYSTYGQYNVTLKITDSEGLNAITLKTIIIIAPPHASFTYSPTSPEAYKPIEFNASSSTPNGGSIISYTWNFGDGNVTTTANPIISHIYKVAGDYTVTLNVTDNEGLWDTATEMVHVTGATNPNADFTYHPTSPYVFEIITLDASTSTGGSGNIVTYTWNFGDGNITTVTAPIITHKYSIAGNYTITLVIETNIELNASISKVITVLPICDPTASFTWSPASPGYNQTVAFDASGSSVGWNGTTHPPIILHIWDFGDGNSVNTTASIVYHVFSQPGNYMVTLTVIDEAGRLDTVSKTLQVLDITVKIYDINGDGYVGIDDIVTVAEHFGETPASPNWNPRCDVNSDNYIGIDDIVAVAEHFGEPSP